MNYNALKDLDDGQRAELMQRVERFRSGSYLNFGESPVKAEIGILLDGMECLDRTVQNLRNHEQQREALERAQAIITMADDVGLRVLFSGLNERTGQHVTRFFPNTNRPAHYEGPAWRIGHGPDCDELLGVVTGAILSGETFPEVTR